MTQTDKVLYTDDLLADDLIQPDATLTMVTKTDLETIQDKYNEINGPDIVIVGFTEGQFADCWVKFHGDIDQFKADYDLLYKENFAGLDLERLIIREPGTHPGGNAYWIEPDIEIFVPVFGDNGEQE